MTKNNHQATNRKRSRRRSADPTRPTRVRLMSDAIVAAYINDISEPRRRPLRPAPVTD